MIRYNCGGFASFYGPCGGTDCDSCYPGYRDDNDEDEETPDPKTDED